jgi:tetratricopeptide (TPR) repeat protein
MENNTAVADQNTERLIQAAYQPEPAPQEFVASLALKMTETAKVLAQKRPLPPPKPGKPWRQIALIVGGMAACVLVIFALASLLRERPGEKKNNPLRPDQAKKEEPPATKPVDAETAQPEVQLARWTDDVRDGMQPRIRPAAPALPVLKDGQKLATKAGQRKLVQLGDGTRLYVNEKTEVEVVAARQLTLHAGQIYLEVAPQEKASSFVVKTANRELTATGTHFAVEADAKAAGLVVTQGKVAVKGIDTEIAAGQQVAPGDSAITSAPRASHTLAWTRDLMAASETPMVPACQHGGGELIALDPQGQEIKLALRQYHIDVHIEDGFARTTIDQTYFNTTWERLEGTFYFPLPADASLSRLAMYVVDGNQCKLMEGGMAERKHAADVYETIRYMRRDPALLEWLDGSTFKMRVFPLEAKQEKRIILSYTQKLPSLYGAARYRFTGGLNMPVVNEWSFNCRIKSGAGMTIWSPTLPDAMILPQGGDTLVQQFAQRVKPAADVTIEMKDKTAVLENDVPRFASVLADGQQYLMLRYRPTLPSLPERKRRDWIVLFEASAQRDPIVAGTQLDILRNLLKNAEYDDSFVLLTANSKVQIFDEKPRAANPANASEAIKFLESAHLVGALDLEKGLQAALKFANGAKNPHVLHIGSGIPAMGQRDAGKLAQMLPERVPYVGVGVGKRWNRAFMKAAAERTNGLFTQINPDEVVAWRAFELLATLNTPRLLGVQVFDATGDPEPRFLSETTMIAQGEEICAMTRVGTDKAALPGKVVVKGTLDGKPFVKDFVVTNVLTGAGYLPRIWAKLEIDRLLAADSAKHKDQIIALSKAMYVMTPYTSLLVLETDADYETYKVDRGRKDHWAMYQCPPKIPLVYEPEGKAPPKEEKPEVRKGAKPSMGDVMGTIRQGTLSIPGAEAAIIPLRSSVASDVVNRAFNGNGVHNVQVTSDARSNSLIGRAKPIDLLTIRRLVTTQLDWVEGQASAKTSMVSFFTTNGSLGGGGLGLPGIGGIVGRGGDIAASPDGDGPPMQLPPLGAWKAIADAKRPPPLPAADSAIAGGSNGIVNEKIFNKLVTDWGRLPPLEARRTLNELTDGMSPRHRQAIEAHFRKLDSKGGFGYDANKRPDFSNSQLSDLGELMDFKERGGEVYSMGRLKDKLPDLESEDRRSRAFQLYSAGAITKEDLRDALLTDLRAKDKDISKRIERGATKEQGDAIQKMEQARISVEADFRLYRDLMAGARFEGKDALRLQILNEDLSEGLRAENREFGVEIGYQGITSLGAGATVPYARNANGAASQASLRYERPQFDYNRTLFTDLLQYAPSLSSTWADVLATLEEEADVAPPKLGSIDPAARKLLDKARSADWQTLSIPAHGPIPGYKIHFNGISQFTYERVLGSGLGEQVICDGKTLYHLYPEIGLAAKRRFSRHHHDLAAAVNPALLPAPEELARGYDLKALDASTIALVPLWASVLQKDDVYTRVHLVFARDGRLSERRIVEMPSGKTLVKQIFQADGNIEWRGEGDKVLAKQPRSVAPAKAPSLQPDVGDLVVVPLPLRTPEHINAQAKKRDIDPDRDPAVLSERFVAGCLMGNPFDTGHSLAHLFAAPANRKLGYYVLLNATGANHVSLNAIGENVIGRSAGKKWTPANPELEHPKNALAIFVSQAEREMRSNDQKPLGVLPGPKDGFIQKLGRFRDLWLSWHNCLGWGNQAPAQNFAELPAHKAKVLEFLQDTPSPLFAYAILDTMQRRCSIAPTDRMMELAVKRFGPITSPVGLGYVGRYEYARSLYQAGLTAEAGKQFRELYADTLKFGLLPPLDPAFRDAVQAKDFIGFIRKTADELLAKKRFGLAFQLAAQMDQLGDQALCDEVLTAILAKASDKERNALTLVCAQVQAQRKNFAQADRLLARLLTDKDLAQYPELWRGRSALTKQLGQTAESVRCLEKALDLEFADLPEVVNLESIRADYRLLLGHYQKIAEASASLEKSAPKAFLAKVIRAADRWRLIDPDAAEPCKLAGKILQTAGMSELAWDYWTTPIDLHPAESKPWLDLAETLKAEGDLERADRAFALGFEAEPTNPEILWQRAQNLARLGQPVQARTLYRQIADGQWQQRFNPTVDQARGLAGK